MAKSKDKAFLHLLEKVRLSGIKLTKQREAICEIFFREEGHRGVEEILHHARLLDTNISLATVYRTLNLLQEYGLAKSHNFQDGKARFEPCFDVNDHHDHLICTRCGLIIEFVNQRIEKLQVQIAKDNGFLITNHKMELYGLCAKCK